MALAQIEPVIAGAEALPGVASSGGELLAERLLLGIIAVLVTVLVPGHTERLIDTPLTWDDLAGALHSRRPS